MKQFLVILSLVLVASCSKETSTKKASPVRLVPTAHASAPLTPPASLDAMAPTPESEYLARREETLKKEANSLATKYRVSSNFNQLPGSPNSDGLTWQQVFATSLNYFITEPGQYSEKWWLDNDGCCKTFEQADHAREIIHGLHIQVMVAYGLFQNGNSPVGSARLRKPVSEIFKNDTNRKLAYEQAVPAIRLGLKKVSKQDRQNYLAILNHAKEYLATFDLAKEDAYLSDLKSKTCKASEWDSAHSCESSFTEAGPDGKKNPFRKLEAFIYRRVKNDGWDVTTMKQVVDQLITDLS